MIQPLNRKCPLELLATANCPERRLTVKEVFRVSGRRKKLQVSKQLQAWISHERGKGIRQQYARSRVRGIRVDNTLPRTSSS